VNHSLTNTGASPPTSERGVRSSADCDGGTELTSAPGDVVWITAGHNGWTIGHKPRAVFDLLGVSNYPPPSYSSSSVSGRPPIDYDRELLARKSHPGRAACGPALQQNLENVGISNDGDLGRSVVAAMNDRHLSGRVRDTHHRVAHSHQRWRPNSPTCSGMRHRRRTTCQAVGSTRLAPKSPTFARMPLRMVRR
jgi:hypothetical protein